VQDSRNVALNLVLPRFFERLCAAAAVLLRSLRRASSLVPVIHVALGPVAFPFVFGGRTGNSFLQR
jgi:hypothetical protein